MPAWRGRRGTRQREDSPGPRAIGTNRAAASDGPNDHSKPLKQEDSMTIRNGIAAIVAAFGIATFAGTALADSHEGMGEGDAAAPAATEAPAADAAAPSSDAPADDAAATPETGSTDAAATPATGDAAADTAATPATDATDAAAAPDATEAPVGAGPDAATPSADDAAADPNAGE
jgi:hypothetical protein